MIAITDPIKVRKDAPSGTIVINRSDSRNALSRTVVAKLQQAFEDFQGEKSVKAVIITGEGNTFSSGTDLDELNDTLEQSHNPQQQWQDDVDQLLLLIETMLRFPKPVIAAVNGWVVGSGATLMLASDIVVASQQAKLKFPEAWLGLVSGLATPLLAFRIGAGPAAHVILTGQTFAADQLRQLGLLHECVADDLVWARAHEMACEFATGSHQSYLQAKQLINETIGENLITQLNIGAARTASARTTMAAASGIKAFVEKRKPKFD